MSTITTPATMADMTDEDQLPGAPDDPSSPQDQQDAARPPVGVARITPRLVWVVVVIALAASVALGATRGREWYAARQTATANADATAAARQLAINFVSVNYATVDADTARVRAGATGDFLKSYSTSVDQLKKVLVANQTVSTVQRSEAALVSGDLDSAVALVGVVAPTKNTAVPAGETKTYRMRIELRKIGSAWKVENLEFVG